LSLLQNVRNDPQKVRQIATHFVARRCSAKVRYETRECASWSVGFTVTEPGGGAVNGVAARNVRINWRISVGTLSCDLPDQFWSVESYLPDDGRCSSSGRIRIREHRAMSHRISRRRFLKTSAAAVATGAAAATATFTYVPRTAFGANERVNVACIGVTNQGAYDLGETFKSGLANIVALCDVDESRLNSAAGEHASARKFNDFRRMFDAIEREIDAVVIAIPDHQHAFATLAALRRGKHVYCEKPLTHDPHECRTVIETAAKARVATQMGTQIHASNNYRRVVELVRAGAIGPVQRVHCWVGGGYVGRRPDVIPPTPAGLNWEAWIGPAPQRAYDPSLHPFNWRGWWNYGTGMLGDMACHHMDLPHWALGLTHPETIEAHGPETNDESAPPWLKVDFHYPARAGSSERLGEQPPVHLTWYHGGKRPDEFAEGKLPAWGNGTLFVGEKGMLLADYDKYRLLPEKDFEGFQPPAQTIAPSVGHHKEFLLACQTGSPTLCNFNYSGPLAETVLLGNVSYRSGKKLEWDDASKSLKNAADPDVAKFFARTYRPGWEL
jgi:predicted dehydrogenase